MIPTPGGVMRRSVLLSTPESYFQFFPIHADANVDRERGQTEYGENLANFLA